MSWLARGIVVAVLGSLVGCAPGLEDATEEEPRFAAWELWLEVPERPVAAWQVEVSVHDATVVGIEGGETDGFHDPPLYDPAALVEERLALAAFSTTAVLDTGAHRIATLHLRQTGEPRFGLALVAAASADGERVEAHVHLEETPDEP